MAASNINRVVLTGNLTRDPELRSLQSGTSVCSLRIASNSRRKENGEWVDKPNYFSVTVWGLYDARSWRASQQPLLFDGQLQAKPAYYGIADPAHLPAHLRTANVFGGDVALNASAFSAVEWQQLPPIGPHCPVNDCADLGPGQPRSFFGPCDQDDNQHNQQGRDAEESEEHFYPPSLTLLRNAA